MANTSAKSPEGMLAFLHVITPRARAQGKEPDFSLCVIFDKKAQDTDAYRALERAVDAAIDDRWPGKSKDAAFRKRISSPFKDGGEKSQYPGFNKGDIYIAPWTKIRPGLVDRNLQPIMSKDEIWAGQIGRVFVNAFAWENSGKMGVSFGLNHVQITKGEGQPRIDGRVTAASVFDDELSAREEEEADAPF